MEMLKTNQGHLQINTGIYIFQSNSFKRVKARHRKRIFCDTAADCHRPYREGQRQILGATDYTDRLGGLSRQPDQLTANVLDSLEDTYGRSRLKMMKGANLITGAIPVYGKRRWMGPRFSHHAPTN